ncbi:hypothetical protein Sme01_15490 [Sphaerisporangium melleum]|uniref:Uncharacterized protein n=1 Tax=Sphaerisporangium melleum TaxID=321316 RepID=A0A917RK08_9ACTN|nr:DUF6703 family protein [Sphaerisporangium melleum]GGL11062.1 hypothetical protein GCM10007964_61550 [Sphaerisporangium melleum]GII69073.1 hypothetical protein Sme01_15490 [Sphaerisporangium melleum]
MADKYPRRDPSRPSSSAGRGRAVPGHPLSRDRRPPAPGRPLPPGERFLTPGATGTRRAIEHRSAVPLVFLYGLPRWILPVALVILLLVGLAVPDWRGGVAVLPVLFFVVWLAYLSWPSLGNGARLLRAGVVVFLLALLAERFGLLF